MAIEIIQTGEEYNAEDISVPNDATESTQLPEGTEIFKEPTSDSVPETGLPDAVSKPDSQSNDEGTTEDSEGQEDTSNGDTTDAEYFFGDTSITVEIPDDVRTELEGKGLNVDTIVSEMYAKGNEGHRPSEETMQSLYSAFGKFSVDAYFNALDIQNKNTVDGMAKEAADIEAANEARWTETLELVGGEDKWAELDLFAQDTFTDEEFDGFNMAMGSGNSFIQNMAILDLQNRLLKQKGDESPELIEGGNGVTGGVSDTSPLSREDYIKEIGKVSAAFPHDKAGYANAMSKLDARRRAAFN